MEPLKGKISPEQEAALTQHLHEVLAASRTTGGGLRPSASTETRRLQQHVRSLEQRLNRLQELVGHLMGALDLPAPD